MFNNLFPSQRSRPAETTAEALQQLAVVLQPVLRAREQVLSDPALPPSAKEQRLRQLAREARSGGLQDFNALLERVCRSYCRRYETPARFEVDDFVTEVISLTYSQLALFDPQVARFSTWFSSCILPRVYSDMQRRINPSWGRPQPKTTQGNLARQEVLNIVRNLSLDQPTEANRPLGEVVADRAAPVETQLLEAQCQEYFLEAVGRLAEGEQWLLRRVYVLQEPQKDIAASLGITPAAISIRFKKIYRRLAELLGESFDSECGETQFCEALRRSEP
ncbi:sigma-70 family RNA polymerase sigma factor [Gloeobacter kilaueensis]|uniref:DNA-directed RNA polymerase specialized sigma subunit n=1 Tax=Gloeobacter kilaueensis (strain ATCC BAA-2537 / CCAP 1431/1 / ULC 316 / JS1) TaxID=1183438 RepID=U5QL85_GLOK1|nr:sigma-70 family RNA polymerase sigma factor [Gloeobacter kilaueensis]AGY59648.1 DNA-directed RNA polymerase specialized sigma subunit [Gloeobacter kilaueensis JS1]